MPYDGNVEMIGKIALYDRTLEVHESIGVMNETYASGTINTFDTGKWN